MTQPKVTRKKLLDTINFFLETKDESGDKEIITIKLAEKKHLPVLRYLKWKNLIETDITRTDRASRRRGIRCTIINTPCFLRSNLEEFKNQILSDPSDTSYSTFKQKL